MRRKSLIALLLFAVALTAAAQMPAQIIPADTAFRVGRLSNGLTYYIRYKQRELIRGLPFLFRPLALSMRHQNSIT